MKHKTNRSIRERGSALISALAIVAMTSLLMSGVCVLATSHTTRQRREADYELAMQLAEAGVNYEINYYTNNSAVHTSSSPATGSISGIVGSYSVYSDASNPTLVTATGTVGGITRKVSVSVSGSSVFDGNFAVFGTQQVNLNGNTITGTVGSNSTVNGSPSTSSSGTCTVKRNCSDNYDTCDNICARTFPSGWSTLSSSTSVNNQCNNVRCYYYSFLQYNSPYWTTNGVWPPTSSGHTIGSATTCTDTQCSYLPGNTIILSPGDYYFTTCQLKNCNIVCDNNASCSGGTAGPVRIWCGGNDNTDDQICTNFNCTSSDKSLSPKCFYNKAHTCTVSCSSSQKCGFYGVKCGKTGSNPCTMVMDNCHGYTGTCIGDKVTMNSNTSGTSSANISHSTDPTRSGGFGFSGNWKELVANSGAVFADGTSN